MSKFFHPRWKWTPKMFGNPNFWESTRLKKTILYEFRSNSKNPKLHRIVLKRKFVLKSQKWRFVRLRRKALRPYILKKQRVARLKYPNPRFKWPTFRTVIYKKTRFSNYKYTRRLCKKMTYLKKELSKKKLLKKKISKKKRFLNSLNKKKLYLRWIKISKINNTFMKFTKLLNININLFETNLNILNKEALYLKYLVNLSLKNHMLLSKNLSQNKNKILFKLKNKIFFNLNKSLIIFGQIVKDLTILNVDYPFLNKLKYSKKNLPKKPRKFFLRLSILKKATNFKKRYELAFNNLTRRFRRRFLYKKRSTGFKMFMSTKRCVRHFYGISNKHLNKIRKKTGIKKLKFRKDVLPTNFKGIYKSLQRRSRNKYERIVSFLERRLDIVLYRFGFVKNIFISQQIINCSFVYVNGMVMNFHNHLVSEGDIITINPKIHKILYEEYVNSLIHSYPYLYHFIRGDRKKQKKLKWFRKVRLRAFKRLLKRFNNAKPYNSYKRKIRSNKLVRKKLPTKYIFFTGKRVKSLALKSYESRKKSKRYYRYQLFKIYINHYKRRKFRKKIIFKFLRKGCFEIDFNRFIGIFIRPTSFFKTLYPYKISLHLLRHNNYRKIL